MERTEKVDLGERLVLTSFLTPLAYEVFGTALAMGIQFNFVGLLYGAACLAILSRLANPYHHGERSAVSGMKLFALSQLALTIALLIGYSTQPQFGTTASNFALPISALAWVKALIYGLVVGLLVGARPLQHFFAFRRGEPLPVESLPVGLAMTGVNVTLAPPQAKSFASLSSLLRSASILLLIVGAIQAVRGLSNLQPVLKQGLPALLEGLVAIAIGMSAWKPARTLADLKPGSLDMAHVMNGLKSLKDFANIQAVGLLLLAALMAALVLLQLLA